MKWTLYNGWKMEPAGRFASRREAERAMMQVENNAEVHFLIGRQFQDAGPGRHLYIYDYACIFRHKTNTWPLGTETTIAQEILNVEPS